MLLRLILLAVILITAPLAARADNIETFDLNGTGLNDATVSGTLTIDVDNGVAETLSLLVVPSEAGHFPFSITGISSQQNQFVQTITSDQGDNLVLFVPDLVGYTGGSFELISDSRYNGDVGLAVVTPEPATLILMLTGLAGVIASIGRIRCVV